MEMDVYSPDPDSRHPHTATKDIIRYLALCTALFAFLAGCASQSSAPATSSKNNNSRGRTASPGSGTS